MATFNYYNAGTKGYMWNAQKGELQFIEVERPVVMDLVNDRVTYNGKEIPELYANEKAYAEGRPMAKSSPNGITLYRGSRQMLVTRDEQQLWYYTPETGVASDMFTPTEITLDGRNNSIKFDKELPSKEMYNTREEVLEWTDIWVEDEDGTLRIRKGTKKALALNEEQKAALEAVKEAMEKARKVGVCFIWDNEEDTMRAIGLNGVSIEFECNYDHKNEPEGWCRSCDLPSVYAMSGDYWMGYDSEWKVTPTEV